MIASDLRWVSCSLREFPASGRYRHLVYGKSLTTMCGHSANVPGIWRGDKKKPQCRECLSLDTARTNN